jgi:hypothetical protein
MPYVPIALPREYGIFFDQKASERPQAIPQNQYRLANMK